MKMKQIMRQKRNNHTVSEERLKEPQKCCKRKFEKYFSDFTK